MIHRMDLLYAMFPQPAGDLGRNDTDRAGPLCDVYQVGSMVAMTMGNKDIICLNLLCVNVFHSRIARKKRVEQDCFAINADRKSTVTVKSESHL